MWLNKTNLKWKKPVEKIIVKMSQVLRMALENNLANDITYTKKFLDLLKSPFYFQRQAQQVDMLTPPHTAYHNTPYDEELGDGCFARVLGSYVENGRWVNKLLNLALARDRSTLSVSCNSVYSVTCYLGFCLVWKLLRIFHAIKRQPSRLGL